MTGRSSLVPLVLFALAGCASPTRIDAARGDIAHDAVEHEFPPLALTVAVEPFEDATGAELPRGELDAFARSYAKVLRESRVFARVFYTRDEPPGAPADLLLRGTVRRADLYRNYGWIWSWVGVYVVSFGFLHPVAALCGLPYATDNAALAIEARLQAPAGLPVLGPYPGTFERKKFLNIYDERDATGGFCTDPRIALQEVTASSIRAMLHGRAALAAYANSIGRPGRSET
jgi:hypothetical protein